jgi:hypothetical protein
MRVAVRKRARRRTGRRRRATLGRDVCASQ